jgi:uncharacterized repeat protein (TIGR01451 family)
MRASVKTVLVLVGIVFFVRMVGSGREGRVLASTEAPAPASPLVATSARRNAPEQQTGELLYRDLLAKAVPDECFDGIGQPYPPGPPCATGSAKVNEAYVWGLAKAGSLLWLGTAPNVHCLVIGGYLGVVTAHETDSWVCEFGESAYSPPLPATIGDWRPPHIYVYDLEGRALVEKIPGNPLLQTTLGIRSAGAHDGVVFLGGPGLSGGVNMFAFNADTQAYLGAINLPAYTNLRKWLVVDGVLYTAMRATAGTGHILRWRGDLADPFQFEVVGLLNSEGAELAFHDGRLFVSTWPDIQATPPVLAGLYMSPPLPAGGLTAGDAANWQKVWDAADFEPDPVTAATYGGGALASYGDYLVWGTMHVPFLAGLGHFSVYGPPADTAEALATLLGSHRAISIFRGKAFGSGAQEIELLYGMEELPTYVYDPASQTGSWQNVTNKMGAAPRYGSAGFDNFYNNYTWTMAEFDGSLFVGTMDYSYLFREGLTLILQQLLGATYEPDLIPALPAAGYGADLYRFTDIDYPAVAESTDGVGNYANYGIRTMLAADVLYLGSANPMNLMTDPTDDRPEGGWELIRLVDESQTVDLALQQTVQANPVVSGDVIRFDMEVANLGPAAATNSALHNTLPTGATFLAASASQGECTLEPSSAVVHCALQTIGSGSSVTVTVEATAEIGGGTLANAATVAATEFDVDEANNHAESVVNVLPGVIVYQNDFEAGAGPEWSKTTTASTPSGRTFLGQFGNESITLNLEDLPPHATATVYLDLYVIRSWDGNLTVPSLGPDLWRLEVDGTGALVSTTFSNWPLTNQAYPGSYPGDSYPAQAGAVEVGSLGYAFGPVANMDAVYRLQYTFPRNSTGLAITFTGAGLQELSDESWGIDNVFVAIDGNASLRYLPVMRK